MAEDERIYKMQREIAALRQALDSLRALVNKQALDEGLWFVAETVPEGYLQQELRKLHAAIEAIVLKGGEGGR